MKVSDTLEKLSQYGMLKLGRPSGDWHMVHCPFHKDGQESKPSCGVSLKGSHYNGKFNPPGQFHCFTCGAVKTLNETLQFLFDKYHPSKDIIDDIQSTTGDFDYQYDTIFSGQEIDNVLAVLRPKRPKKSPYPYPTEEELSQYRYTIQYMYDRKLTDDIIEKYDVGFDANWQPKGWKTTCPSVTFPVRDRNGVCLFIARRSIAGKNFFLPENIRKPVYGLDMIPEDATHVCICESIFNALTCVLYGHPAVALLSTGDEYQYSQLSGLGVNNFILCLDPDEAGQKGTERLIRKFKNSRLLWKLNIPEGKDVNDLSKEEFDFLFETRQFI